MMLVIGLCIDFGSMAGGGATAFGKIALMAVQKLPAIFIVGGIAALLFGLFPKVSIGGNWAIYSLFILMQLLWEMALIPDAVFLLTPFGAGLSLFKRRDIQS